MVNVVAAGALDGLTKLQTIDVLRSDVADFHHEIRLVVEIGLMIILTCFFVRFPHG